MDKKILIFVLATATTVLGQRDLYRPAPAAQNNQAQERAYLDNQGQERAYDYNDYEDYSPGQSAPAASATTGERGRAPPKQTGPSLNTFAYQTDCKSRERTLPHEKYCDHFYQLNGCSGSDDQAILRSCPNGLVYTGTGRNGLIGVCDYPHRSECSGQERHNPPISTEHCDWLYGIFGHETSCTRYWTCWNGTATEQFCIGGLLYNEETHACDWPQNVGGCQKHPLCKDDPNGNVPLGKSCNRYWACQGGYPRLQRCPAMLVFDKNRKRCTAPPTEDCEVPATTPPTEEDNNRNNGNNQFTGQGRGQGRPQPSDPVPESRRRFQTQLENNSPRQQQQQSQPQLPFDLPQGATLLQRPPQ